MAEFDGKKILEEQYKFPVSRGRYLDETRSERFRREQIARLESERLFERITETFNEGGSRQGAGSYQPISILGPLPSAPEIGQPIDYQIYAQNGGGLSLTEWQSSGSPAQDVPALPIFDEPDYTVTDTLGDILPLSPPSQVVGDYADGGRGAFDLPIFDEPADLASDDALGDLLGNDPLDIGLGDIGLDVDVTDPGTWDTDNNAIPDVVYVDPVVPSVGQGGGGGGGVAQDGQQGGIFQPGATVAGSGSTVQPPIPADDTTQDNVDIFIDTNIYDQPTTPAIITNDPPGGGGMDWQDILGAVGGSIGDIFAGGGAGGSAESSWQQIINAGLSDYASDALRDTSRDALRLTGRMYDEGVDRLEPFRQAGLTAAPGAISAAGTDASMMDLFAGQQPLQAGDRPMNELSTLFNQGGLPGLTAGDRGVQGPTMGALPEAREVAVNQFNPYDAGDPALQYLQDESQRMIEGSRAARGKLGSGGTGLALQDAAQNNALLRANQIQQIESARDQTALGADAQRFYQGGANQGTMYGQSLGSNQFANMLNQQDLANRSGIRAQLTGEQAQDFGQGYQGNQFTNLMNQQDLMNQLTANNQGYQQRYDANVQGMGADQQQMNQLMSLLGLGGNAAAAQGQNTSSMANQMTTLMQNQGGNDYLDRLGWGSAIGGMF